MFDSEARSGGHSGLGPKRHAHASGFQHCQIV